MSYLLEHTGTLMLVGTLLLAGLLAGWYQLRDSRLLLGVIAVLVVMGGWLVVDRLVVTERERIERVIDDVAEAVLRGDAERAVSHFHRSRQDMRDLAISELKLFQVTAIEIKRPIKIELVGADERQATKATARFNIVVTGGDLAGLIKDRRVPRYLEVEFFKEGDRWWVDRYEHHDPLHDLRKP
ncbi:MAG: hypothetical protein ACKOBW_10645 [Planctomycetota bacterium]